MSGYGERRKKSDSRMDQVRRVLASIDLFAGGEFRIGSKQEDCKECGDLVVVGGTSDGKRIACRVRESDEYASKPVTLRGYQEEFTVRSQSSCGGATELDG